MNQLEKALEAMPSVFTSSQFNNELRVTQAGSRLVETGAAYIFLLQSADRPDRVKKKTWHKRKKELPTLFDEQKQQSLIKQVRSTPITESETKMSVEEMVSHLKSVGYKVYKPSYVEM